MHWRAMSITEPTRMEIALTLLASRIGRRFFYAGFVNRIRLRGDESVIDFGSGWGDNAYYLAKRLNGGGRVTLLDISSGWQTVARRRLRRFANLSFVNADIFSANLPDDGFDLAVISYVLHDIPAAERRGIVTELARKLKPGGSIYLREPTSDSHGMPVDEIEKLMHEAGFSVVRSETKKKNFEGLFSKIRP